MKRILYSVACCSLLALVSTTVSGQGFKYCGTTEVYNKVIQEHPEVLQQQAELEQFTQQYSEDQELLPPVIIIPVVFHVIHNYGPENITDAQVFDAVRILNEDFRKLNADTVDIIPQFQSIAADSEIEFRLAQIDPQGNCTNGIDRVVSLETYIGDDGSKLNYWPRDKYLNIWVVNSISNGAAGYAYLPGTAPNASKDGIIILSSYVGSIGTGSSTTARALTHEVGHFLNLQHVWGSTNQPGVSCGNDGVSDTPVTEGWTSCNLSGAVCTSGVIENVQNFMDYSYCYRMFTAGQRARMRAALQSNVGQRSSLWTSANHAATGVLNPTVCAPKADFLASFTSICPGDNVTFYDYSWNATPTSWSWSFPGGTPSTSNDSMPVVSYSTPGLYNVTLTSGTSAGTNSKTRTGYIRVRSTTASVSNWQFIESLESVTVPNNDWVVNNGVGPAWAVVSNAGYSGASSLKLSNVSADPGDIDEVILPSIDLTAIQSPTMTFQVAFAQKTSSDNDRLRVMVSTDCGKTWQQRYMRSGNNLKTVNPQSAAFTPNNASQWRMESVNIGSFAGSNNVLIKFDFKGDGGNNVYVDDINVVSSFTGLTEGDVNNVQLNIYPNPAEDGSVVSFILNEKQKVSLAVCDVLGREVMNLYTGDMLPGEHLLTLNASGRLNAGVYFVKLQMNGRSFTQKVLVR
jgi:PKD repeat protein